MYGLLGKTLKHSFSKQIHNALGNAMYELYETENIASFLNETNLNGFNVTIPYKEQIIPYLSRLDGSALRTLSVNTVVKQDQEWVGYNTDYDGFVGLLNHYDIHLTYKKVLIIGNGGSSKTIEVACKDQLASYVTKICRHPKDENELGLSELDQVVDYDVIINTTPVGMYPHNEDDLLFSLDSFQNLQYVIDIVYNPLNTKLVLAAKEKGMKAYGGLFMLVKQAAVSHSLFFNTEINDDLITQTYRQIKKMMYNIILIGLPLSGKSKYAKILSQSESKTLIDTDASIESVTNKTIASIFNEDGESTFRRYEQEYVDSIYKSLNQVISTGGGMVMNPMIMMNLKQNGLVLFLDKNPERIASLSIKNRPLISSSNDVYRLAEERYPLYKKYADAIIHIERETSYHVKEIEGAINEYLSH